MESVLGRALLSTVGHSLRPTYRRSSARAAPWITTFSALAIMLAVLAVNLVGDALRDLRDPRLRSE